MKGYWDDFVQLVLERRAGPMDMGDPSLVSSAIKRKKYEAARRLRSKTYHRVKKSGSHKYKKSGGHVYDDPDKLVKSTEQALRRHKKRGDTWKVDKYLEQENDKQINQNARALARVRKAHKKKDEPPF